MSAYEYEAEYERVLRLGKQSLHAEMSKGQTGYLTSLDGVIQTGNVLSEMSLGLIEIPLKKVVGTYTHSRSIAFAQNFMPIMPLKSEFASKWMSLYKIHIDEGIRDPIKVYEYYNLFYVMEGNKRVSVLKSVGALSIHANVIRLIPKKDPTSKINNIYYEFTDFYKKTGINSIWFSEEGSFTELVSYLEEYNPVLQVTEEKYKKFLGDVYRPFREIYYALDGDEKDITTGDAFLHYIKVYGMPQLIDSSDSNTIESFMTELDVLDSKTSQQVKTDPILTPRKSVLTSLGGLMIPKKRLKIAFVYPNTPMESGWVNAHELGRLHIDNVFGEQILTNKIENVPEDERAYETLKELAEDKYDIIFTTSPTYTAPALKTALEFPNVKFFNCAGTHSYNNLTLYFGRIHEPWYLLGLVAGAATETDIIGFLAPLPISEVVSAVNAFALGAQAVNPRVVVKPAWTYKWQNQGGKEEAVKYLKDAGVDVIGNESLPIPGSNSREYGVYKDDTHYAMAIWDWGVFYEKVIQNILSGTWKIIADSMSPTQKPINFWLGMDTGIVDIMYSNRNVSTPAKQLIDCIKKSIIRNEFNVFEGPIHDQKGVLKVEPGEKATYDQIITMDWFVQGIVGEMPQIKDLSPTDPLSYMRDIVKNTKN
ncbi:MAG TPA: BMP family ABC transporter substrate-binding protein [Epulopiscium sp.]|nr:BMP family ABC transporter substrate-binding protein [Candidatus Epulonipiscium sp.]